MFFTEFNLILCFFVLYFFFFLYCYIFEKFNKSSFSTVSTIIMFFQTDLYARETFPVINSFILFLISPYIYYLNDRSMIFLDKRVVAYFITNIFALEILCSFNIIGIYRAKDFVALSFRT